MQGIELWLRLAGFQAGELGLLHTEAAGHFPQAPAVSLAQLDQFAHNDEAGLQVAVGLLNVGIGEEALTDLTPARVMG